MDRSFDMAHGIDTQKNDFTYQNFKRPYGSVLRFPLLFYSMGKALTA